MASVDNIIAQLVSGSTGSGSGGTGQAGANGKTILNGTGVPAVGLGNTDDFYIDTAATKLYGPKTTVWGPGINLIGSSSGTAATSYTYALLPKASTVTSGTEVIVSDYPLYPNGRRFVSDGTTWLPTNIDLRVEQLTATRQGISYANQITSNATAQMTSFNQAYGMKVKGPVTQLRFLFSNNYIPSGQIELSPFTVDVAIAGSITINPGTANAQVLRLFWEDGGNPQRTLKPGDEAWCYVDGINLANGEIIVLNTHVEFASAPTFLPATSTTNIMISTGAYATYDGGEFGTAASPVTDKTMVLNGMPTAKPTGMFNSLILPPMTVVGMKKYSPAVAVIGDSNRAWALGGLATAGVPAVDWGCGSYKMITVTTAARARLRRMRDSGITHVLCTMGGGDFTADATDTMVWAWHQQFAQVCKDMGMIYIMSTTPPKTVKDSANTATDTRWPYIQAYNTQVRNSNGMGFGYFDLFDCWGVRATGLWRTDLGYTGGSITNTDDGTHANGTIQTNTFPVFAAAVPNLFK